jgi:hypothetical protein
MFLKKLGGQALRLAFVGSLVLGIANKALADTDLQFAKYLQSVKWSGDMRLRFDNEHFRDPSTTPDRERFRMRLRIATDFGFPGKLTLKTRLASGVGEQTSTNQTFGSLGTQKGIFIDRAYLEWKAKDWLTLTGGKMAHPLWTQYSSDAVWDADFNPEGAGENLSFLLGNVNIFLNAMQMVADEDSASTHDQYVFSEQLGIETRLPFESRLKVAYAYHDWRNTMMSNFQGVAFANGITGSTEKVQEGNRGSGGILSNEFGVSEVTGVLSSWIVKTPIAIQGTFLKNNRISDSFLEKKDAGYQVGAILGKAGVQNGWEVAYFYKYLDADATVADAADSDFGDGGTNRRGHICWVAYSPFEYLTFQAKYFQTQNVDPTLTTANGGLVSPKGDMDRVIVDASVRF